MKTNFLPPATRWFWAWLGLCLLLGGQPGSALAQPAYQGLPGAEVFKKAQQQEAAGNRAAVAALYQQAYAAYRSVDDSDGMTKALAKQKELAGGAGPATLGPPAAARAAGPAVRLAPAPPVAPAPGRAAPVAPLAGSVAGGRPVGLFFMSRYLMALHSLEKATYYFTPSGQVFVNPSGFSAAALAALPAGSRGTYTQAGSQLTVRWVNGQTEASAVEPQATTFGWDMGLFLAVRPFASARQLVGTFEGGNSVSLGGGSTAVVSTLTLRADGTYSRAGSSTLASTDATSTARAGASSTSTGRWQLAGWLLTLTSGQGQATQGVAYPIETDEKTGQVTRFYFDNLALKRL